ncbi:hypothetical protein [Paraburkholderia sp. BL10I2N1]|uniref:hypothetical protein n=1 Tax=Paraburkholderia sp. BL10I2N1 TaxID=1938796 RepID=UPI00105F0E59|nr:hypothetical protein [Paraburkholderia sp. BL10I2N1]TDN62813.1 hypothetical protein B0G77_6403 [Paraburkholderia sp. BL10I2N1]
MSDPVIKKPTKKAFHFPTGAEDNASAEPKPADAAPKVAVKAKPAGKPKAAVKAKPAAAPKAERQKRAAAEAAPVSATAEEKSKRVKKEKVVRDSFTMPKSDYAKIAALKVKCLEAGVSVKKSELLRAGLLLLESAPSKRLLAAVSAVETVKTGRPARS